MVKDDVGLFYLRYVLNYAFGHNIRAITIGTVDLHFIAEVGYMLSVLMQ